MSLVKTVGKNRWHIAKPIGENTIREVCMGTRKFRGFGLIAIGAVAGVLLSVGVTAVAQRGSPLPLDELRQLSNVFAAIKNNYVEAVDDKTLIDNAISGMVSNLDPHSAYLDADAFREMQTATQGEFGGLRGRRACPRWARSP